MFVYLGLGSNQGDRIAHVRQALEWLTTIIDSASESSVYESAPMYVTDQPYFLNMAVMGETTLSPHELLQAIKMIEAEMGRDLSPDAQRYGPRPIDIDILLATKVANPVNVDDYIVMDTPDLTIPHPRLTERAFVLYPLLDISRNKNLIHPLLHTSLNELKSHVKSQGIVVLGSIPIAQNIIHLQMGLRRVFFTNPDFPPEMSEVMIEQWIYRTSKMMEYSGFDSHLHLGAFRARYGGVWLFYLLEAAIRELQHPSIMLDVDSSTRERLLKFYEFEKEHHSKLEDADFVWHGKKQNDATSQERKGDDPL